MSMVMLIIILIEALVANFIAFKLLFTGPTDRVNLLEFGGTVVTNLLLVIAIGKPERLADLS